MASSHQSSWRSSCLPAGTTVVDAMAAARSTTPFFPVEDDDDRSDHGAGAQHEAERQLELRRGPWTVDEDLALVNYITDHGEGRWNSLAQAAGLKRTGKSCRLRWLNYLRPDVKRGNFTADEQLLILDLHSRYGNRWSKIAQHLPGRTDNEIKNYWRTRVQKHAKQLNCDANSARFKDAMRYLWMPHLVDDVEAAYSRRRLLHEQQATAADVLALSSSDGLAGLVVTSSSSTADSSPLAATSWEAAAAACDDDAGPGPYADVRAGEMLLDGGVGGDVWVQEMNNNQGTMVWPGGDQQQQKQAQQVANDGGGHQFDDMGDLSGWVQSFSEGITATATESFWTLEDIWRMQ